MRGWAIWKPPRRGASQWPPMLCTVVIDSTPFLGVDQVGHRRAQDAHGLAGGARQALARRGQGHLARQTDEQRLVQALLEGLHLPADGGLGDAQLVGGAGEALQARGGFEDPDGAERQAGEDVWHKWCL
jgi:hypothetical protein